MAPSTTYATSEATLGRWERLCATAIPKSSSSTLSTVSTISFMEYGRSSAIQYVWPDAPGRAAASSSPSAVLSTYDIDRRDSPSPRIGAFPSLIIVKNVVCRAGWSGPVEPARTQDHRVQPAAV